MVFVIIIDRQFFFSATTLPTYLSRYHGQMDLTLSVIFSRFLFIVAKFLIDILCFRFHCFYIQLHFRKELDLDLYHFDGSFDSFKSIFFFFIQYLIFFSLIEINYPGKYTYIQIS